VLGTQGDGAVPRAGVLRPRGRLAALAGMLATLDAAACRRDADGASGSASAAGQSTSTTAPAFAAVVAPVFRHGEGRVTHGCQAITPPTVLSEAEALQVIRDELRHAGVELSQADVLLPDILVTGSEWFYEYGWVAQEVRSRHVCFRRPLQVDLLDARNRIAVEYVADSEYAMLGGPDDMSASSVFSDDLPGLAAKLGAEVRAQGRGLYFGVIYDPVVYMDYNELYESIPEVDASSDARDADESAAVEDESDSDWDRFEARIRRKCRDDNLTQLRAQVRDFVEWLKGQGAI